MNNNLQRRSSISNGLFEYLLLFILLCFSGNPLFIELNGERNFIVLSFLVAAIAVFRARLNIFGDFIKYSILFFFIYLYHLARFQDAKITTILFFTIKTFIGIGLFELIGKTFVEKYFNLMAVIAGVSLLGFAYNTFVGVLPSIELTDGRYSSVIYTQIYGEYFLRRNSGMFWEPGAFQGYVNLALLFSIFIKKQKLMLLKVLTLMAALLTTYSTTGYIAFAFVGLVYLYVNRKMNPLTKFFLGVVFVVIALYAYRSLDFLEAKITENAGSDNGGRIAGYGDYFEKMSSYLFLGRSYIGQESTIYVGGNGFLGHLIYVGVVGVVYYYSVLLNRLRKQTKDVAFPIVFISFLIVIYQGEGFLTHPFFLGIAYMSLEDINLVAPRRTRAPT